MLSYISGDSGSSQGASIVAGGMNDVFECLLEEVASYEQNDHVSLYITQPTVQFRKKPAAVMPPSNLRMLQEGQLCFLQG